MQVQALTPRILGLVLVSVVACSAPKPNFQTAWQSLLGHLSKCTAEHGYDPSTSDELGRHELGKNEGQWRACAYAGIEVYMIPATVAPDLFRKLVRLDREMTGQVARGDLSRSARKSRIKNFWTRLETRKKLISRRNSKDYARSKTSWRGRGATKKCNASIGRET